MSSYLDYDEYGLKTVRCMNCNKEPIQARDILSIGDRSVLATRRNSSYRTKSINIKNCGSPSKIDAMLCADCVEGFDKQTVLTNAMDGMRASLAFGGKSNADIEQYISEKYALEVDE